MVFTRPNLDPENLDPRYLDPGKLDPRNLDPRNLIDPQNRIVLVTNTTLLAVFSSSENTEIRTAFSILKSSFILGARLGWACL